MTVLIAQVDESYGLPVVPQCTVIPCADEHFLAVDNKVTLTPGGRYRGHHKVKAKLWRAGDGDDPDTGEYAVEADVPTMAKIDPQSLGRTFAELAADPIAMATWPCKDGIDGSPRISSALGCNDTRPVARVAQVQM